MKNIDKLRRELESLESATSAFDGEIKQIREHLDAIDEIASNLYLNHNLFLANL